MLCVDRAFSTAYRPLQSRGHCRSLCMCFAWTRLGGERDICSPYATAASRVWAACIVMHTRATSSSRHAHSLCHFCWQHLVSCYVLESLGCSIVFVDIFESRRALPVLRYFCVMTDVQSSRFASHLTVSTEARISDMCLIDVVSRLGMMKRYSRSAATGS